MACIVILKNKVFTQRKGMNQVALPVEGAAVPVAFTGLVNITNASGVYTSTAPAPTPPTGYWTATMYSSFRLSGDGYVQWPLIIGMSAAEGSLVGFDAASTHTGDFSTIDFCMTNYNGRYHRFKNGTLTDSGVSAVAGDQIRIRRDGTTLTYEKQTGGIWTTLFTDTGVSGDLYVHACLRVPGDTLNSVIASGLS